MLQFTVMLEKLRIKLINFSDWYDNVFTERWGFWGYLFTVFCIVVCVVILFFGSAYLVNGNNRARELSCQEGHFVQRDIYNAATKTTQLKYFFVCDKD